MSSGDGLTCLLRLIVWTILLVIFGAIGYFFWFLLGL